ncbi:hypothetical protein SAMN04487769_0310 [Burkholderia sp. b14]|nr:MULTISPECIES: hypothetical protein [unclassified Mycetohabitans]MCF2134253.1 hypothetical protein [Mycetohabitans sp. B3]MCG1039498.1 hypothetical protein [Mycetohabitans sp. B7]SIT65056.1 hypothetical protein SAMN04487769_0310 [Burkholderia sp. b14]
MISIRKLAPTDHAGGPTGSPARQHVRTPVRRPRKAVLHRGSIVFAHSATAQANVQQVRKAAARARLLASIRASARLTRRRLRSRTSLLENEADESDDRAADTPAHITGIGQRDGSGGGGGQGRGQRDQKEEDVDAQSEVPCFRQSRTTRRAGISRLDAGPLHELARSGKTIASNDVMHVLIAKLRDLVDQAQRNPHASIDANIHHLMSECLDLQARLAPEPLSLQHVIEMLVSIRQKPALASPQSHAGELNRGQRLNPMMPLIAFNALRPRTPSQLKRAKCYQALRIASTTTRHGDTLA